MDKKDSNKTKKFLSFKWIIVIALAIIALSSVLFIVGFNTIKARTDFYDHTTDKN